MEKSNKVERSEVWNNIYEVLARLDLKEVKGDSLDRPSAATEIEQAVEKLLPIHSSVSGSLRFSEREVDFAYLCGVFNTSGIDGLHNEVQRLKELGKEPHHIIEACRKQ